MKVCKHCGRLLPSSAFPSRGGRVCRACYRSVYPGLPWSEAQKKRKVRRAQNAATAAQIDDAIRHRQGGEA